MAWPAGKRIESAVVPPTPEHCIFLKAALQHPSFAIFFQAENHVQAYFPADLVGPAPGIQPRGQNAGGPDHQASSTRFPCCRVRPQSGGGDRHQASAALKDLARRSEERRVGKEWRRRWG